MSGTYTYSVRRLSAISLFWLFWVCLLGLPIAARADDEPETIWDQPEPPPPKPVPLADPGPTVGDHSKVVGTKPLKLDRRGKVKECCGYPIALREGFRLSFYWLAYEQDYAAERSDTEIYTPEGFFLGKFPSAFVFELKLEGTAVLMDGRVINYAGECRWGMGTCFKTLDLAHHPLGVGVQNRALVPFRSIAVDPRMIPIGAPVYVPELVGLELPDGTLHDGCLRADDQGGAIKDGKLDFFVESYLNFKFLAENLWWRLKATPHLEEPRCEYLRLREPRERYNEHTDWIAMHRPKLHQAAKAALAKIQRNRAVAAAWVKRHSATITKAVVAVGKRR